MCEAAEVAAETGASAGFGRFGAAVLLDDAASEVRFGGPKDNFCWASGIGTRWRELDRGVNKVRDSFHSRELLVESDGLRKIETGSNEIGDEGVRHLGDALTRGAAPALEELYLRGNPASDAAKQALLDARPGLRIFY